MASHEFEWAVFYEEPDEWNGPGNEEHRHYGPCGEMEARAVAEYWQRHRPETKTRVRVRRRLVSREAWEEDVVQP